jgi:hypothetical protein
MVGRPPAPANPLHPTPHPSLRAPFKASNPLCLLQDLRRHPAGRADECVAADEAAAAPLAAALHGGAHSKVPQRDVAVAVDEHVAGLGGRRCTMGGGVRVWEKGVGRWGWGWGWGFGVSRRRERV